MKILTILLFLFSSTIYSSDQFLQQCMDFRSRLEADMLVLKNDVDLLNKPSYCTLKEEILSLCVTEKNFKNYISSLVLKIENIAKEKQLYDDKILRCSFFTFHRVRLFSSLTFGLLFSLLSEYGDINRLLKRNYIHDNDMLRKTLRDIKHTMDDIQYLDSLNIREWPEEWPDRIELNEILNDHLIDRYGHPKNAGIDFVKLMIDHGVHSTRLLTD